MSIFRSAQFSATNVVTFLLYGAFAAALFMLGLVLQGPLGYSPLARRGGNRAADDHDAAVLGPCRSHRPTHRPAHPDDRWAAAVRRWVRPADPCRARTQLRRRCAPGHPRVLRRVDADSGAVDDHGVELGVVAPRWNRLGRQQRGGAHRQPRRRGGHPGRRRIHRRRRRGRRHPARRLHQGVVGEHRRRRRCGDRVGACGSAGWNPRSRRPNRPPFYCASTGPPVSVGAESTAST